MKKLLKFAIVLPLCLNTFFVSQAAYSGEINNLTDLYNTGLYDINTEIKDNIILDYNYLNEINASRTLESDISGVVHLSKPGKTINIIGNNHTIDGNSVGYKKIRDKNNNVIGGEFYTYTPEKNDFKPAENGQGTGFGIFNGTTVNIENLNFTNYIHRERGTIYINNSTATLDNITMIGCPQVLESGHIWGSLVAIVDGSINTTIKNSTFRNVDLTLDVPADGGSWDVDGGVLHVQGHIGYGQSTGSIINSKFHDNKLTSNRNIYGGAVYNEGILEEVSSNTEFKNNQIIATGLEHDSIQDTEEARRLKTGGFGGAFSLGSHNPNRGNATITTLSDTWFEENSVTTNFGYARGGALWSGDDSIIGSIIKCTFKNNKSVSTIGKASGGAIYNNGNIGKIVGSTFIGNYVQSPNEFDHNVIEMTKFTGAGGAIFTKKDLTIQGGTEFSGNSVRYVTKNDEGNIIAEKTIVVGNDIHLSDGAKLTITPEILLQDSNGEPNKEISISSGISSKDPTSTITVQDGATLNLSGVNQFFTGRTNIKENSILNFTQTKDYIRLNSDFNKDGYLDSFLGGTVNLEETSSVLKFENTHTDIVGTVTNLIGEGIFNKTGAESVEILNTIEKNADGAITGRFTGNFDLDEGKLTVHAAQQSAAALAAQNTDFTATIGTNTEFIHDSGPWIKGVREDCFTLNKNFGLKFDNENSNATLKFIGHGTFKLEEDIANAAGNKISINNATVKIGSNTYNANYAISASTINLQHDNDITDVRFNDKFDLTSNVKLEMDFDFSDGGKTDTISAANGSGTLQLLGIKVLKPETDIGEIVHYNATHDENKTYNVLNNTTEGTGVTFIGSSYNIASDIYEYTATTTKGKTGLELNATGVKENSLYLLNHVKEGENRYFYLLGNTDKVIHHAITPIDANDTRTSLDTTLAGTLHVIGKDNDPSHSIITGDKKYSFFQNDTNSILNISNVTLQEAKGNQIAAVLDITKPDLSKPDANVNFSNVIIKDNTTEGGNASAISNVNGTVILRDVKFSGNTGTDAYIYNAGTMHIIATNKDFTEISNKGVDTDLIINKGTIHLGGDLPKDLTLKVLSDIKTEDGVGTLFTNNNVTFYGDIEKQNINIVENSVASISNNSGITDGIVNVIGGLSLNGNTNDISITSNIMGGGNIEKSDNVVAEISGLKNDEFTGKVSITGGTLKFVKTDGNTFFAPTAKIIVDNAITDNKATFDYTTIANGKQTLAASSMADITVKNGGTFKVSGLNDGSSVIRIEDNIVNSDIASTNNLIFENADYTLGSNVNFYSKPENSDKSVHPDNLTFNNAKVRFEMDDNRTPKDTYEMGNANWELNNSEFRFLNKVAGDKYNFDNLTMKNSKISLDLDLTLDEATNKKPYADTFYAESSDNIVNSSDSTKNDYVEIIRIGITADNGEFDKDDSKGIIQVFTDKENKLRVAEKNNTTILNWGTNVYKYTIESASSGLVIDNRPARELDSIRVIPKGASTTGTLRDLNRYELKNDVKTSGGNRGFSFIVGQDEFGNLTNQYSIYRDLDTTSEGHFSVLGTVDKTLGKSVLDGTLKDIVTTVKDSSDKLSEGTDEVTGEKYIIYDDTKITESSGLYKYDTKTKEYTISKEAFVPADSGQKQGSMFEIVRDTDFYMSDLVVKNAKRYAIDDKKTNEANIIAGIVDGSVIYAKNSSAKIQLENVDLQDNSVDAGNGGAIANLSSQSFGIDNMKAGNNKAGKLGGVIYTESAMTITDSDFGVDENGQTALNYQNWNGTSGTQNDIYIKKPDANTDTELIYSVSKNETHIINSGIAGDGTFIKSGEGTLTLNGKNDDFTGLFAVDTGKVLYTKTADNSFVRGDVRLDSDLEMSIGNGLNETIQNVSGNVNGILVKSGDGILNLTGKNSGFNGTVNIEKGSVNFTATADDSTTTADESTSYIGGSTVIADGATLNYTANKTAELNNVSGEGTINYFGDQELTFNAKNSTTSAETNPKFTGLVNINGKQLNVLGASTDSFDFNMNIQSGILNYAAADGAKLTLNNSSKVGFEKVNTGAQAIFGGGSTYTLGNITNVAGNTVTFDNTTVKVSQDTNTFADGNYELQNNAILSLVDKATGKVNFESLSSNDGKLSLDVDLGPLTKTPKSDILNVANGRGTLTLTTINVLNERKNKDDGLHSEYSFGVIEGNSGLILDNKDSIRNWATSAYEYKVSVDGTGKGIIMKAIKASDGNSLTAMNQYDGTRGFQFRKDDDKPYVVTSNLGTTAEGIFTVNGAEDGKTVISGDNQHSFFDVQNKTNLTINDVTITNANKSNGTGAVINAINKNASIVLNNVTLENNIDVNGKNDIYIAQGAKVTANNSAINSGLGGAGIFNANNSTLSGKNDKFTGILNVGGDNGLTFNQTDAGDSYISGTTNVGASSVTLNIDKGNTTAGNFVGTGTITKTGAKDISVSGDNSGFTGNVNINNGAISYNADNTKYFGGNTIIEKDGGLKVTTNNGTKLSKISGNGTLSKDGTGALTIIGDNSGFSGNLNVNNGTFALASGSTIGTIANGAFAQGTVINLQNTSAVQYKGDGTTNFNPASIQNLHFDNLTLNGNVGLNIDVDLKNTIADTISANNVLGNGHLVLKRESLNVVSDSLLNNTTIRIASGAVANGDTIILSGEARSVMGPIQKYDVTYSNGNLGFFRQGGSTPSIDSVNPSVMASPVATQIGGYLSQLETLHAGFFHMDRYTKYSKAARLTAENTNRYAISETPAYSRSRLPETSQAMWTKPYTSFEKVQLRGGVGVSNVMYGSLYGGDTNLVDIGHGFKGVISAFVGYNGSHQSYNGISMNQQGGTLGVTGTIYKGNFFTGLTASAGASAGEAYTAYGQDNFAMMTAGIANKTGYNWEIKDGAVIIQPSLFLGYTFVNTFDYTNAAGVRMDSDPLHAIQVIPGVRIIGNLKNGWQPYAGVDMVWNIIDKTNVMANDVRLPQLSVKPYVQYGVGLQKSWGERFTAFFQTMIRNGGRNGIVLSAGFRWAIGKDYSQNSKTPQKTERKVIKSL